jgi:aryl-alcohol dehydrogenase-like predicted oxidoreductase
MPRFHGENMSRNRVLVHRLTELSSRIGVTPAQLALAWLLHKSRAVHVIPGSKTQRYLEENQRATHIALDDATIRELDELFSPSAVSGERYPRQLLERSNA